MNKLKTKLQDFLGTKKILDETQKLSESNINLKKEVEELKAQYKNIDQLEISKSTIDINKLFQDQSSELSVIKGQITKLLPHEISSDDKKELLSELNLTDDIKLIRFADENLIDKIGKAKLVSRGVSQSGLINSLAGIVTSSGLSKLMTNGLYTTNAKPEEMVKYASGLLSSFTKKGNKISKHIGFSPATMAAMMPMIAFQAATIITSQAHLQEINKKLEKINEKLGDLLNFHKYERVAKLKYINHKITEYNNRQFFTIEDFVIIEQFKYDLESIKEECFLHFENKLNEKFKDHNFVNFGDISTDLSLNINLDDSSSAFKRATNSVLQTGKSAIKSIQNFAEKSTSKFDSLIKDFSDSQVFSYAELALTAEKLYESILTVELMANLKVKNIDQDRVGKVNELRDNLANYKKSLMIEPIIRKLYVDFKNNFGNKQTAQESKSFEKHKYKIDSASKEFFEDLEFLEELLSFNTQHFNDNIVDAFEDDYEIIVDNNSEEELIYMRKIDKF